MADSVWCIADLEAIGNHDRRSPAHAPLPEVPRETVRLPDFDIFPAEQEKFE